MDTESIRRLVEADRMTVVIASDPVVAGERGNLDCFVVEYHFSQ